MSIYPFWTLSKRLVLTLMRITPQGFELLVRLMWPPRANNPLLIVRERSCGAANTAKQSRQVQVVCICHIRQSLEISARKTAPVLHPQSIINSQGRMDRAVRRRESGGRERKQNTIMEVSLFVLHLCCISKTPQKGALMRGAVPRKKKCKCQSQGWS